MTRDIEQPTGDKIVNCQLSIVNYNRCSAIRFMNKNGQENRPFLFVLSYDGNANYLIPLDELDSGFIRYDFSGSAPLTPPSLHPDPQKISFETYREAFEEVRGHLLAGNSFLTNLTASTPVSGISCLEDVFFQASARYKLWVRDRFVCFSPESFVTVSETGEIATFPMKGTLDAGIEDAEAKLRADRKELYEHTTIVDLLRNDLSTVADQVRVERFQYIDRIRKADDSGILQMSSEIRGQLPSDWKETLGDWFFRLLPAGSICGAPKPRTLQIIQEAEKKLHEGGGRGFYSGVCGVFDGKSLTSAVMIRFIEQVENGKFVFKSGGGITHLSDARKEYEEIYQKIYVPA